MADSPLTKPAAVLGQLGQLWSKQPKSRKAIAIVVLLGIAGAVAWTSVVPHGDPWVELGGGASPDDVHELLTKLQNDGIPARLTGGKLEVPTNRAEEARALAAAAGLPHAGKGFELFDGSSLGESSFSEQVKYRRALEGELARSITSLAQIESARVHLALGKRSVFKSREEAPSASVALHLHGGQQLQAAQVQGVRQLVAASVEGLRADAVVVLDSHGNLLEGGDPSSADRKADIERTLTTRVRAMLERVVGVGKVSVVASADLDERKVQETEEFFDKDKQAVRSESRTVEGTDAIAAAANAGSGVGGVAGARGNLPGAPGATVGAGSGNFQKVAENRNYEVSRTVRQTVKPDSQVTKLHLAVVVDYKPADKAGGKPVARTAEELAELTALASQAAGLDPARGDKIEMRSIAFAPEDGDKPTVDPAAVPTEGLPLIPIAAGAGGAFIFLVLLAMFARRRRRNRRQLELATSLAMPVAAADLERMIDANPGSPAALPPALPAAEPLALPPGQPIHERVSEAVRADIDRAASVLQAWLQEAAPRESSRPVPTAKPPVHTPPAQHAPAAHK